jgi:glc operon protein GlcG
MRMDGAPRISGEVSIGKARTSAMTGRPSKFFEDMVKVRPAFVDFPGTLIQGGVPLLHESQCVGGIGVSGCSRTRTNRLLKRAPRHSRNKPLG